MRQVFKVSLIMCFVFYADAVLGQQSPLKMKYSLVLGRYDTLMEYHFIPDSLCHWTDTSSIRLSANIEGFHQIDDGMNAYFVGTPIAAGTWWLYYSVALNVTCHNGPVLLGDDPEFTVIDPLSVAEIRDVNVRLLSNRFLSLQSSMSDALLFDVLLYDLLGHCVMNRSISCPAGTSEIDLGMSGLPAGCYWYTLRGDGWSKSGKVMKLP